MNYWIAKSEPEVYPWAQLVKDKKTAWTGIRSAEARNNLRLMKIGDQVAFYHSNEGREVVGIAHVVTEFYPDPTAEGDPRWVCVELAPLRPLAKPVTLTQFKADALLRETKFVKQGRLSVTPLSAADFARIVELGV